MLELKHEHHLGASAVDRVEVEIFDVAYNIIGGGEEGRKTVIRTKEEADHSLRYILAVALLDGQVMPEQYTPTRIANQDVQDLLRRVSIRPQAALSRRFPNEMPCRLTVHLRDGRSVKKQKSDYDGFHTRPATWDQVQRKFEQLSNPYASLRLQREIVDRVAEIENTRISELSALLARVGVPERVAA
jgi:2-methylcitrate dehydratase